MKKIDNGNRINCCFCEQQIPEFPKGTGWTLGNNAEPVIKNGRCCNDCNIAVVLPRRIADAMKYNMKGVVV